jgi:hypothetical protein
MDSSTNSNSTKNGNGNKKVGNQKKIIGYFHVCQIGNWQKSFDMIFSKIIESGLYDITEEIRVGIVNNNVNLKEKGKSITNAEMMSKIISDIRLNDPKIKIIFCKHSSEYERPTLLHLRENAKDNTLYYYLHTKGIRHFVTEREKYIIQWIDYLLYWNIIKWRLANKILTDYDYDTYGCNAFRTLQKSVIADPIFAKISHQKYKNYAHYSGNFWWAKGEHIKTLPRTIGLKYTDPELWICIKNNKMFNIHSSGFQGKKHYQTKNNIPNYKIPNNFNLNAYYRQLNSKVNYESLVTHYLESKKKVEDSQK